MDMKFFLWFAAIVFGIAQSLAMFILNEIKHEISGLRKDIREDVKDLNERITDHLQDHATGVYRPLSKI
jgi:site-specific DNA-adenine methylase